MGRHALALAWRDMRVDAFLPVLLLATISVLYNDNGSHDEAVVAWVMVNLDFLPIFAMQADGHKEPQS